MTAPERPASGLDANARGIVVLVVAVAVGVGLLLNVGAGADESASPSSSIPGPTVDVGGATTTTGAGGTDTTDTTATGGDTTTTSGATGDGEAKPAGEVSVVVLNGSDKDGAAKANSETIGSAGYVMGTPGDGGTVSGNTVVYYAEGYEADAIAVAAVLGKAADAAQPKPEEDLGPGAADANVVVVLGAADTAPVT